MRAAMTDRCPPLQPGWPGDGAMIGSCHDVPFSLAPAAAELHELATAPSAAGPVSASSSAAPSRAHSCTGQANPAACDPQQRVAALRAGDSHTTKLLSMHAAELQQQQQGLAGGAPRPLHLRTSGLLDSCLWDTAPWQPYHCGQSHHCGPLADIFAGPAWIDTLIPPAAPGMLRAQLHCQWQTQHPALQGRQ
jgi:hypothetical protein